MTSVWLDIIVRVLLGCTLVMAQAALLNWLEIPFAAVGLFAGFSAYIAVAGPLAIVPLLAAVAVVFVALVRPLPSDQYLLLTLAALELAGSAFSSTAAVGGQLGAATTSAWFAPQRPAAALPYAVVLFGLALALLLALRHSHIGLTADLIRIGRRDQSLRGMAPTGKIIALTFAVVAVLASMTGRVQGAYAGWVDPGVFSIEAAVTLLVATLVIRRRPLTGTLLAAAFFAAPDLFSLFVGYNRASFADLRDIIWGVAVIALAGARGASAESAGAV